MIMIAFRKLWMLTLAISVLVSCGGQEGKGGSASLAGSEAGDGAEAAARVFADAIKAGDFAGAARLMHPKALSALRTMFEPMFAAPDMQGSASEMFGVTPEALASTPDTVLFAGLMRNIMGQSAGLSEALRTAEITPLGHVPVGDTMMVVSRMAMTVQGITITQDDVMPFVYEDGKWWALLKSDITNMAAMLQQAMKQRET
jgi:hypothetical protein